MDTKIKVISTLKRFEVSSDEIAWKNFIFTIIGLIISVFLSVYLLHNHSWLSSIFWFSSAILLCRFFVLEHDAGHLSLFTNKKHNRIAGIVLGFFTMIPSSLWNHIHNTHHGILGNLDKRKINPELWTLTVHEFQQASFLKKLLYRFMRSIFARLILTPAIWIILPRIPLPHLGRKIFISILVHDLIYGVLFYYLLVNKHFDLFIFCYLIPLYIFNLLAAIFFYLNHQYEHTSWEKEENWDLYTLSISGSGHLIANPFWSWVSGNVGCHHIHHLNTKIPSFNLAKATEEANQYLDIKPIYLHQLFYHLKCALWDEDAKKLISFRTLKEQKINLPK